MAKRKKKRAVKLDHDAAARECAKQARWLETEIASAERMGLKGHVTKLRAKLDKVVTKRQRHVDAVFRGRF
jgi:hypothetical protein